MPDVPRHQPVDGVTTVWAWIDGLAGREAESAWREFVERYRPFVRGLLTGLVRRNDWLLAAEDEFWGYVYLSDAIRRADRSRRFRPYLTGIVNNFALAWLRRQPDTDPPTASGLAAPPLPGAPSQELGLWARNVLELALATLAHESPVMTAALRGFYGLGDGDAVASPRSASELAAKLSMSVANVYQLLSRGRRRLRTLVEEELLAGCADASELDDELKLLLQSLRTQTPGLFEGE